MGKVETTPDWIGASILFTKLPPWHFACGSDNPYYVGGLPQPTEQELPQLLATPLPQGNS
jgi:hypothetical protein